MISCNSCGSLNPIDAKFCSQCAKPLSQNNDQIIIQDGVVSGDIHQTNITYVHQDKSHINPHSQKEQTKLNWWGVYVTRGQYFLWYYIAIFVFIFFFTIGWGIGMPFFTELPWLAFHIIWVIGYSAEAVLMNKKFAAIENQEKQNAR